MYYAKISKNINYTCEKKQNKYNFIIFLKIKRIIKNNEV